MIIMRVPDGIDVPLLPGTTRVLTLSSCWFSCWFSLRFSGDLCIHWACLGDKLIRRRALESYTGAPTSQEQSGIKTRYRQDNRLESCRFTRTNLLYSNINIGIMEGLKNKLKLFRFSRWGEKSRTGDEARH